MKVFKDAILFIVRTPKSQEVEILRNKSDITIFLKSFKKLNISIPKIRFFFIGIYFDKYRSLLHSSIYKDKHCITVACNFKKRPSIYFKLNRFFGLLLVIEILRITWILRVSGTSEIFK